MAVKTFTQGEVATAADTNTYLANSGLVYVTSATIGTAVASVTVSSAFVSDFDQYQIVYEVYDSSASTGLTLRLGSATTNYRRAVWAFRWNNTTFTEYSTSTASFYIGATASGNGGGFGDITLFSPYASRQTGCLARHCYPSSGDGWTGHSSGVQTDSTSFTAFTFAPQAGTMTGGKIIVYGYRKA